MSDDIVRFETATVYARKIAVAPKLIRLTGGHRGRKASLRLGYLVVDRSWYPR